MTLEAADKVCVLVCREHFLAMKYVQDSPIGDLDPRPLKRLGKFLRGLYDNGFRFQSEFAGSLVFIRVNA